MYITFKDVTFKYLDNYIIDNASFTINEGDKIGLIGSNGAGKTTLLNLISGKLKNYSGEIFRQSDLSLSYMSQNEYLNSENSVLDECIRLSQVKENFLASSILNKLGLEEHSKKVKYLSGGEQKRLSLAAHLATSADILILDEPTNHLDIEMITFLENFLIKSNKVIILVTHDRYFLERITKKTLEIDCSKVYQYDGGYLEFLNQKSIRLDNALAKNRKLTQVIKKETAWIKMNPQARSTKSTKRIEMFDDLLKEKKDVTDYLESTRTTFNLDSKNLRIGKKTIELINIKKSINDRVLIDNLNYNLKRFDRLGIIGGNGVGKTTILKIITEELPYDSGQLIVGETIKIGYFKQLEVKLSSDVTVLDYLKEYGEYLDTNEGKISASVLLENYHFSPNMQRTQVKRLSGGEQKRLQLLTVLIQNPNVLILDEPTNDLDLETLEVLEDYLDNFLGSVIVISHDRYFLDKVVDHLLVFDNDSIYEYPASITEFLKTNNFTKKHKQENKTVSTKEIPRFSSSEKKEYDSIEEKIESLENELKKLDNDYQKNGTNYTLLLEITKEREEIKNKIDKLFERFEYLDQINDKILAYKEAKK